jgi:ATP-dependent DNA helicase RecQ
VLKLAAKARPLLRGEERLTLARPRVRVVAAKKEAKPRKGDLVYDTGLFDELRALRKRLADEQQVPPFVVFGDATLVEMAAYRPTDAEGMARISGVGEYKLGRYGPAFIEAIRNYSGIKTED